MGLRGPRGEIAAIKEKRGNPGKRPIPETTIVATGEPFVADFLSPKAKAVVAMILEYQDPAVYKRVDGFALAGFATQFEIFEKATREIKRTKLELLSKGSTGQDVINPLLKIQSDALKMMASYGDRLGLDPKARQSLAIKSEERPTSKWDGLMGGRAN